MFSELQRFVSQYGSNQNETKQTLAKEVLAEIPGQVCSLLRQAQKNHAAKTRSVLTTEL